MATLNGADQSSIMLTREQIEDLSETFRTIDINGDGKIQMDELQQALRVVGVDLPGFKVRELMQKYGQRDYLSFKEFSQIGLFSQINLKHVPGLVRLLRDGETLADLQKLSPEEILIRWVNYHMEQAGVDRRLANFQGDIKDSEIYTHLLYQIAPADKGVTKRPLNATGNRQRAEAMLTEAEKLKCRAFVTARDVENGVYKLNLAFVANLFNTWPGLKPPGEDEDLVIRYHQAGRGRLEACGAEVQKMSAMMDQIGNSNYAVDLGKQMRFSLVGIQGKDIYDGNRTLTLGLVWQLMRAYTLSVLAKCSGGNAQLVGDKDIVDWVNKKVRTLLARLPEHARICSCKLRSSSVIRSFQDSNISDGRIVCELIEAIQPNTIKWDLVREDKLENAKYAITSARKIGAKVYALPEDIVEVKPKMVMTVFACLMARDYMPNMGRQAEPVGVRGRLED